MNGFFIIAEISGLQQFLKVDAGASGEMIRNCERCINNSLKAELKTSGSLLVFSVDAGMDSSAELVETSISLLELISSYSEEIHEYALMLIYRSGSDAESVLNESRQRFFNEAVDGGLLVENRIMRSAGLPSDDETHGMFQLITVDEGAAPAAGNVLREKYLQQKDVDRLLRLIVPEFGDDEHHEKIIISGGSELLIRMHIEEAVRIASGKNRNVSILFINILEKESDVIRPFARSIDRSFLPVVEDYLEGVELRTWKEVCGRLENINSDNPAEYFFSAYCLYLKGLMNCCRESAQPAVIAFSGLNDGRSEFADYFNRFLEYISGDFSPAVILIGDGCESIYPEAERVKCCEQTQQADVLEKLSFHDKRLLYALNITEGLFDNGLLENFLLKLDYSHSEIQAGIGHLETAGAVIDGSFVTVMERFDNISEQDKFARVLAKYISEIILTERFTDYGRAADKLCGYADIPEVSEAIFECLSALLEYGQTSWVLNYLSDCRNLDRDISDAVELRCFLLECDKTSCMRVLKGRAESAESPENIEQALFMLQTARYYHAASDYQRALDTVKKVLIFLQDGDFPRLEGIAFTELGFLMLCKGKLLESSEYLGLGIEKLSGGKDRYSLMKVFIFSAIQKYLWGALDESLSDSEKALELVTDTGYSEWYFYIEFFRCRLFFELGRYHDAEKILATCLLQNELYRNEQRRKIFSAWTARACIYQGKIYRGINMLLSLNEDPEVLFFLTEAYYLNGSMDKAVENIEKAAASEDYFNLGFMPLEFISWKNGFAPVESRALRSEKGTGVLSHNIRAMHAFLLGLTGNREYGTEILFSLTRDEKISENDPFNRLYFYFYCQLLERRQNTEMIDKLTLISKALKYLQQTSSRISSPKIRQEFMTRNYWNTLLVNEAQREKLI